MKWKNWRKALLVALMALVLMIVPVTRQIILWILPLGSGVDDLIVLSLVVLVSFLLIARLLPVRNKLQKLAEWLMK